MKKLSAMVMAGVMALGMVGCGSTAAEAPAESTVPAAESTAAETTESTAEAQTETADAQTEAGRQFVVGFDAEFPPYGNARGRWTPGPFLIFCWRRPMLWERRAPALVPAGKDTSG